MNSLTDKEINRASDGIDKALSTATRSNRGEVAFRILSVVRNLNDHIAFKIWKDVRPDQKMDINKVASKFGNVRPYQFVARFDHFLRASVSHFTPSEEGAERLMIKYYRYLLQLKKAVYDRYRCVGDMYSGGMIDGSTSGSFFHWLIRLILFVALWAVTYGIIAAVKWLTDNWKLVLCIMGGVVVVVGIATVIAIIIRKRKSKGRLEVSADENN